MYGSDRAPTERAVITQLGIGTHPIRLDLLLRAGKPFEEFVPVLDAAGTALDLTTWTTSTAVLTPDGGTQLGALTVTRETTGLTLSATPVETATWAATWPLYAPWSLVAVHPTGEPRFDAAGWVSLYR